MSVLICPLVTGMAKADALQAFADDVLILSVWFMRNVAARCDFFLWEGISLFFKLSFFLCFALYFKVISI